MRRSRRSWFRRVIARAGLAVAVVRGVPLGLREAREGPTDPIDSRTRAETADVNVKAVLLTGAGLILTLWAIQVLIYPYFAYLKRERAEGQPVPSAAVRNANAAPPEPRIQADPRRDLKDFRAYEDSQLNGYHWIDRTQGIVSIPIDEAIRMVARRGIPPQPAPTGMKYYDPQAGSRETGFRGKVIPEPK